MRRFDSIDRASWVLDRASRRESGAIFMVADPTEEDIYRLEPGEHFPNHWTPLGFVDTDQQAEVVEAAWRFLLTAF